MKNENNITEAQLLLNQEIVVTSHMSRFTGRTGIVNKIMADDRTLDVDLNGVGDVFLDVSLVGEIQERQHSEPIKSLGPIQNHLVKDTI